MRHVYLSWHELEEQVSQLIFKLNTPYDAILSITRGGIIPGGMIAEALKMKDVLTAAVLFPEDPSQRTTLSWPKFVQFPADNLIAGRKILVVELSMGQFVEDVRLAVEGRCPVEFSGHTGGVMHTPEEVAGVLARM